MRPWGSLRLAEERLRSGMGAGYEPLPPRPLKVNSRYPPGVPLQSTPPTLLLNLPRLPHELQYRLVGHYLVLYDVAADMIVDFIAGAVPAS